MKNAQNIIIYLLLPILFYFSIGIKVNEHKCETSGKYIISLYVQKECENDKVIEEQSCCDDDEEMSSQLPLSNSNRISSYNCCTELSTEHTLNMSVVFTQNYDVSVKFFSSAKIFDEVISFYQSFDNLIVQKLSENKLNLQQKILIILLHIFSNTSSDEPYLKLA